MGLVLVPRAGAAEPVAASAACGLHDVAATVGLDFRHDRGASPARHLPETMGSGVAWLDYDGDGWSDLYVVQSGPYPPPPGGSPAAANRLFRNLGPGAGGVRFADVTDATGTGDRGYGQGATAADADGDGDVDLFVANVGPDVLLLNRGDGTFAPAPGPLTGLGGWSSSAAFADGDGDGDLDLYVTRYVVYDPAAELFCGDRETGERTYCDPSLFHGESDRYFRNRGDGTFEDATGAAGLGQPEGAAGRGLGVLFTDLDGDGRPDLYVANDLTLNLLFRNRGDGTFEDLSLLSGTAVNADGKPEAGMGLAAADFDRDGDPDLAVTNFDVETNTLYLNLGEMQFADRSAASGFGPPSFNLLGFGLVAADLDGDGALDVYAADGHIFEQPRRPDISYAQRDLLLLGDGRGRFRELSCPEAAGWLASAPRVGRGLAAADFDRDGDPDLAVSNSDGPLQLLASELGGLAEGAIAVRLRGRGANPGAVGAAVTLVTAGGRDTRWVTAGDSYQSTSEPAVVFAVPAGEAVAALEIRWPTGERRRIVAPPRGKYLEIHE